MCKTGNKTGEHSKKGVRLITKDYKSREEEFMTKMLNELNLLTLQSRRQKQRLIVVYKVVEGQVSTMPPDPGFPVRGRT